MAEMDPAGLVQGANPFPVTNPELIPAQRYYDEEFYKLECERLWPRVWQMACRLEEIPEVGCWVEYKILDKIGRGETAGVFRAVHDTGQVVALKVLPPSKTKDPQVFGRFQREARLATKLKHPNIVRTFHKGEGNGLHFLVMAPRLSKQPGEVHCRTVWHRVMPAPHQLQKLSLVLICVLPSAPPHLQTALSVDAAGAGAIGVVASDGAGSAEEEEDDAPGPGGGGTASSMIWTGKGALWADRGRVT